MLEWTKSGIDHGWSRWASTRGEEERRDSGDGTFRGNIHRRKTMKKSEFVSQVAQKSGLSKKDTEAVIEASIETITEALKARENVSFLGFGSFQAVKKNEREITIPGTTRKVKVPAKYSVRFKPGKLLKDAVE
jgi:DNA-binding protein HU-beta